MLSTELKSQIQGAYTRFLEAKGLKARYGQRLMIAEVAKVLGTVKVDENRPNPFYIEGLATLKIRLVDGDEDARASVI